MTERPDIAARDDAARHIEDYAARTGTRFRPLAEAAVAQAIAPERSPMLSLVIDQGVIDLTINGDVEHLTINGRVAAIVIAK